VSVEVVCCEKRLSRAIRLVLFDVDGVLTDGSIYLDGESEVSSIQRERRCGGRVAARGTAWQRASCRASSPALTLRARQLKFRCRGHRMPINKLSAYERNQGAAGLQDARLHL